MERLIGFAGVGYWLFYGRTEDQNEILYRFRDEKQQAGSILCGNTEKERMAADV